MLTIYLSHTLKIRDAGAVLEMYIKSTFGKYNVEISNPFKVNSHLRDFWLDATRRTPRTEWDNFDEMLKIAEKIMLTDLELIKECDIVVAYIPETESLGVSMEIFYARYLCDKPVIVLIQKDHPWLVALKTIVVRDIDELIEQLSDFFEKARTKGRK